MCRILTYKFHVDFVPAAGRFPYIPPLHGLMIYTYIFKAQSGPLNACMQIIQNPETLGAAVFGCMTFYEASSFSAAPDFRAHEIKVPSQYFFRHLTLLISYAIVPLYLSLLYLKGTKLSIFYAKVVVFLQKWSISDFLVKEKLCPSFPAEFFVCLKMGDFKQCIFIHIIQVCKTIFSAGFHEAKAPSSICLQYRLYTNTQKVYESIPFISLNFSSPHPWPAPLHPTPWGFPAFPVFEDIQGIYEKEICPLKNKKILPEREGSILSYMGPRSGGIQRVHHGTHRRCEGSEGS